VDIQVAGIVLVVALLVAVQREVHCIAVAAVAVVVELAVSNTAVGIVPAVRTDCTAAAARIAVARRDCIVAVAERKDCNLVAVAAEGTS